MAISLLASGSGAIKRTGMNEISQRSNSALMISPNAPSTNKKDDDKNTAGIAGGIGYLGEKVALNALSGIEGIWDYAAGGVAKLFGADAWAERQFANDWVNYGHADEWYNPDEGWSFAGDIAGGIGSSLPAIGGVAAGAAIAYFSSGTLSAPAAGLISASIAGLGAAGNATKEAYRETGELGGKEFGYGALVGATEGSIEGVTSLIGAGSGRIISSIAKRSAGELTETLAKSGAKNVLKTLGQDFVSEAFEEGVAEILSPVYQRMTYDPNAKNASAQEVAYAALIGGLSGALMSGANVTVNTSQNLISGNRVMSEGKAATVLENARQITEREMAHETGYESFKAVSNTYKRLSESLAGTNGEIATVKQKMLLGQLTRENAVAMLSPFVERSAENIIRNVDAVVERYNAFGMKDASGKPITFTREQVLSGIDLNADRKTYVKQVRKALSGNSTLATLAVADATGNLTMDTRRFAELSLEGKNLASRADYENFRQNATAEEKAAVGAALGIENFDLVKADDFRAAVEQFAADGKMSTWAEQSERVRVAVETAADAAKQMPHILRKNMTDGVYRYTSEDGTVNMAVFKEGSEYHIYDYDSSKISRSLTSQEVNKVLRDVRQGAVSQTSEVMGNANQNAKKRLALPAKKRYNKSTQYIKISKQELAVITSRIMDDNARYIANSEALPNLGYVRSANYFYVYENFSEGDFGVLKRIALKEQNSNYIRSLESMIREVNENGTDGVSKVDDQILEILKTRGRGNNRHYAVDTIGRANSGNGNISSGEQGSDTRSDYRESPGAERSRRVSEASADLDGYARENIKDYNKLSAPNQAEIRAMIREGRALGISEGDVLLYAKISARTGVRVTFDQGKTLVGRRKGSKELVYADGFYDPTTNEICVNPNGKRSADKLLIHELAHAIYSGEKGMRLAKRNVKNLSAEEKKAISDRYAEVERTDEIELLDEYNAHYAEGILGNADTLERLLDDAPTVKDRILDFLRGAKGDTDAQRSAAARRLFFKYKRLFDRFAQQNEQNLAAERMPGAVVAESEKKTPHGEVSEANGVTRINDENVHDSGKKYAIEDGTLKAKISSADVEVVRSIGEARGRISINKFTSEEIQKAEKWARKFYGELGTKSPFFRAWFGDWRIRDATPLKIVNIDKNAKPSSGNTINRDTERKFSWSTEAAKESIINSPQAHKSDISYISANINLVVENAVLLDTVISSHKSKRKLPGSAWMHSLYGLVDIDGKISLIKLFAEEAYSAKSNDTFTRAYSLKYIEKVAEIDRGVHSENGGLTDSHSTTVYSISDLFDFVKRYDAEFSPKSVNPLLLNKDGTPKVLYHGTRATFTQFELQDKPGLGRALGDGFYFTSSYEKAHQFANGRFSKGQDRGGIVMPVYLCMKNPYVIEKDADRTKWMEEYNQGNYDGIVDLRHDTYYVETATQIKSATEAGTPGANIGTFDGSNPDIRFALPEDTESTEAMAEFTKELKEQLNEEAHEIKSIKALLQELKKKSSNESQEFNKIVGEIESKTKTNNFDYEELRWQIENLTKIEEDSKRLNADIDETQQEALIEAIVNEIKANKETRKLAQKPKARTTESAEAMAEFTKELKTRLAEEFEREYDADIDRAKAKDAKGAYHPSLEKRDVPHTDKERAEYWREKAKDNETRAKVLGNISALAQRMKDLKLGTYHNATQDRSKQFAGSVEGLAKITWNGNISVKLARKHIGALRAWYKQDNPILGYENKENPGYYNAEIAEMLAGIADGEGTFSVADLRTIRDIMQYFIKLDETYNKVFKNGKWVDAEARCEALHRYFRWQ